MTLQRIRQILSHSKLAWRYIPALLGCIATADAYLRLQIALETVEKLLTRARRGEEINIFGDRIWSILFPLSSLLIILLLWKSVEFEAAEN